MKIQQAEQYVGDNWWDWSVWIEAPAAKLDAVEFVEWQLHPTFANSIRRVTDRSTNFRLATGGWGTFMIRASVQRKDGTTEKLSHYLQLHFPGMVSDEMYAAIRPILADAAEPAKEAISGLETLRRAEVNPDVMTPVSDRGASLVQTLIAQSAGPKYGTWDLGWITTGLRMMASQLLGSKARWRIGDSNPSPIPNSLRAAVFGDWATGAYGAPVISTSIAHDPAGFGLVMHLGNTFYSGTEKEVRERLLGEWPQVAGALNRTLNGNHDMYSGGHAYFEIALPAFRQQASYFAFQNDYWILAALDTAYSDCDLYGEQVEWLKNLVARAGDRRLVLFTHHQPFSLYDMQGPKLVEKLTEMLQERRIFAWYWSHEHSCILYEPHPEWAVLGCCLGFGGIPYRRRTGTKDSEIGWMQVEGEDGIPAAQFLDGPNPYVIYHEQEYGPHGYAVLEFDDGRLLESIRLADGTKVLERELTGVGK